MRRDVLVYLSGPVTPKGGWSAEENAAAGLRVYLDCLRRRIPAFCPQLCAAFPSAWTDVDYETWIDYSLAMVERSTHMLMLPRWESSDGARRERAYAERIGRPVLLSLDDVPAEFACRT